MLFSSSPTFKTRVKLELEYLNANSSVFSVIWKVTSIASNSSRAKSTKFLQFMSYRIDWPLFMMLVDMPTAWLLPFFLKVPQKSSTGESTITSGIKTTLQSHILVNCDHVGHFSQNRDQSRKLYGFSLSFGTTFRYMSLSMWKFCGVKATLVYFMSKTVPRIHTTKRTKVLTSLPYNLQLVETSVLKRSLDSK